MCASQQEMIPWMKSNFLSLFLKCGKDQWDCEIVNYYVAFSLQQYIFLISTRVFVIPFWVGLEEAVLNVARLHCHKSVCQPKKFDLVLQTIFLMRGWGLGTRLRTRYQNYLPPRKVSRSYYSAGLVNPQKIWVRMRLMKTGDVRRAWQLKLLMLLVCLYSLVPRQMSPYLGVDKLF